MVNHKEHTTMWQIVDICKDTNCEDDKVISAREEMVLSIIKNNVDQRHYDITGSRDGAAVEYKYLPLSLDSISSYFNNVGYEDSQLSGIFNPIDDCLAALKEYGNPPCATVLLLDIHFLQDSEEGIHLVNLLSRHAYFRMPSAQQHIEYETDYEIDDVTVLKRVKYYRYMCCYHSSIGGILGNSPTHKEYVYHSDCTIEFPHGCNECAGNDMIRCIHSCFNYLVAVILGGYESPSYNKISEVSIKQIRKLLGNEGRPRIYRQSIQQVI